MNNTKSIHFRLNQDKAKEMKVCCAKKGITQNDFLKEAVDEKLKDYEED